jgi:hypothetical protein
MGENMTRCIVSYVLAEEFNCSFYLEFISDPENAISIRLPSKRSEEKAKSVSGNSTGWKMYSMEMYDQIYSVYTVYRGRITLVPQASATV